MADYKPGDEGYQEEHDTGDYDDHDDYSPGNKYKVVYGTKDNDTLHGTYKDELFFAGKGDDTVYGNGGDDIIFGQKGNDWLFGGNGYDKIYGGKGDDYLDGGNGDDKLRGDQGDDTLYGRNSPLTKVAGSDSMHARVVLFEVRQYGLGSAEQPGQALPLGEPFGGGACPASFLLRLVQRDPRRGRVRRGGRDALPALLQ
jgi:Ca2+-binding RTX toxin-like protein